MRPRAEPRRPPTGGRAVPVRAPLRLRRRVRPRRRAGPRRAVGRVRRRHRGQRRRAATGARGASAAGAYSRRGGAAARMEGVRGRGVVGVVYDTAVVGWRRLRGLRSGACVRGGRARRRVPGCRAARAEPPRCVGAAAVAGATARAGARTRGRGRPQLGARLLPRAGMRRLTAETARRVGGDGPRDPPRRGAGAPTHCYRRGAASAAPNVYRRTVVRYGALEQ